MAREVTNTGKDDGDITKLCGENFSVLKAVAIEETLAAGNGGDGLPTPYLVKAGEHNVNIRVYRRDKNDPATRYLRTDSDHTVKNNLDSLPDC